MNCSSCMNCCEKGDSMQYAKACFYGTANEISARKLRDVRIDGQHAATVLAGIYAKT